MAPNIRTERETAKRMAEACIEIHDKNHCHVCPIASNCLATTSYLETAEDVTASMLYDLTALQSDLTNYIPPEEVEETRRIEIDCQWR